MTTRTTWADLAALAVLAATTVVLETLTSPSLVALTPPHLAQPLVEVVLVPRTRARVKAKTYDHPFLGFFVFFYQKLMWLQEEDMPELEATEEGAKNSKIQEVS